MLAGEPLTAAGDVLLVAPPNGEAGGFVAPPNIIPDFEALASNIDPGEVVPNPVVLPPKIFPLEEVVPKIEFMLLPPNIEVFEEVAGVLENTELEVLPNGVDAGLIIGFPKIFAVDAGVCTPGNCAFDTGDAIGLLPNAGVIEVAVVVTGIPKEIVPAEVALVELIPKLTAGILVVVVSPNVGLLREVWKGDTVLLAGIAEELVVTPADVFANPLNTDVVVGAKVDVPKVDVIDGKETAPKVVVAGSVIVSDTVAVFFMMVWPPNIGAAANGTWAATVPKVDGFTSGVVTFSMTTELVDGISVIDLRTAFVSTTLMVTPPRVITDVTMAVVAEVCAVIIGAAAAKLLEVVIVFTFPSALLLE